MSAVGIDERFGRVLEAVYATVTEPQAWRTAVQAMCDLFGCHFGDAFARTTDFQTYRGVAHGLEEHDYQHGLLDGWVKRNVWSAVRPVREAGVVVTTREMMDPGTLRRSEMYADYLHARGLHEGLRLDVWAAEGWVQDVSLLRSWSAGPFDARELELARLLLPHLQRAADVARRLSTAEALGNAGFEALDAVQRPVFLTNAQARVLRANRAGEHLLQRGGTLSTERMALAAGTAQSTRRLRTAVAQAACGPASLGPVQGAPGQVQLHGPAGERLDVTAVPVSGDRGWTGLCDAPVLVVAGPPPGAPDGPVLSSAVHLAALFDLTPAEADVARLLVAGRSVAEIAADTRRSPNTVRTHLARLMTKTGTHRQAALVRALLHAPPEYPAAGGPRLS